MKKILFVTSSLSSGGAERVMTILANEFITESFDISIFSKSKITPFYELNKRVKVIFPKNEINYNNYIRTLIGRLRVYYELFIFLRNNEFDVIIPFSTSTSGVVIVFCKLLRIPVIASEHNNYKYGYDKFYNRFIKRYIYKLANKITVLTERDKKEYYDKYLNNVVVMPNPLPIEPLTNLNKIKREKIILAIGNVSKWNQKGFDNLLKIFAETIKIHPEWKLNIAGAGEKKYIINLISELKLTDKVNLIGQSKDIEKLMQLSSIFALSSRFEGLPMVLIEAISQGLPCIAFDCFTGPRDVITNNFDGILVDDQNNDDFIKKLNELIDNDKVRKRIAENAIETSKIFLPEIIVNKWKVLIKNIEVR